MFKKAKFLFIILLLILAACSSPDAPAEDATEEEAPTAEAPAATDNEEVEEEVAEEEHAEMITIGMMKIVSHPALDAEQQGVKEKTGSRWLHRR